MLVELPSDIAVLRFGLFALDLRRRELRRDGRPVRIAKLPFEALRLLAAHPQVALTRAELIAALWPGQLADRSENLDTLMRQVRAALGDSAQNPRFIQTVRGVGFCFLAEVIHVADDTPALPQPPPPDMQPPEIPAPAPAAPARRRRWLAPALAAAVLLALATAWIEAAAPPPPLAAAGAWVALTHDGGAKPFYPLIVRRGWVYFTENRDGHFQVERVRDAGGAIQAVPTPGTEAALLAAAPDGGTLIVKSPVVGNDAFSDGPLWRVGADGFHPLGALSGHAAAWSPDGTTILLARGSELWSVNPTGGQARRLLALPRQASALAWSPDGTTFRFALGSETETPPSLWEARRDGSRLRRLGGVGLAGGAVGQAWRPDGKASVVVALDGDREAIWEFPAPSRTWAGTDRLPRRLDLAMSGGSPGIAFDTPMRRLYRVGEESSEQDAWRYDAASHRFSPLAPGVFVRSLDYSPRGDAVAYSVSAPGSLWRAGADFSTSQQLTPLGMITDLPRWSPDGRWIAFTAETVGQPWNLDMVPSGGGAVQVLAVGSAGGGMGAPTWSPDGESLYFGRADCPEPATCGISRLDLRSRVMTPVPGSMGLRTARLSPDGRHLAALGASHQIVVEDLPGGTWRTLTTSVSGDALAWSSDSRYVYGFQPYGTSPGIFRVALDHGTVTPVASLAGLGGEDGIVGGWFGLDRQNRPIVARRTESSEIFAAALGAPRN